MKLIPRVWNLAIILYSVLAIVAIIASMLIVFKQEWNIGANIIFIGSIVTLVATILTPMLSMKIFKLNAYKIKLYSLLGGILSGIFSIWLLYTKHPLIIELMEFSKDGLIWGINTALLLIGLVILEVENNEAKIKEVSEEIVRMKKESLEDKKKMLEMQEEMKEILKKGKEKR